MTPAIIPRILLYAHDGRGLGHVVRTAAIAQAIREMWPQAEMLALSGEVHLTDLMPAGVECVKLPSYLTKEIATGFSTSSPTLSLDRNAITKWRTTIVEASFRVFNPNIVLVDFFPMGKRQELADVLAGYRNRQPSAAIVLGLRPVVDSPKFARQDNLSDDNLEFVTRFYDVIAVYGDKEICDFATEYILPTKITNMLKYVGLIVRPSVHSLKQRRRKNDVINLLVGFGSGHHSEKLFGILVETLIGLACRHRVNLKMVCGPRLNANLVVKGLKEFALCTDSCHVVQFSQHPEDLYEWATHFVGYAGSNTVNEVLASKLPALFISRSGCEEEQAILLSRLRNRGHIFLSLDEQSLTAAWLSKLLSRLISEPVDVRQPGDTFSGAYRTTTLLKQLYEKKFKSFAIL